MTTEIPLRCACGAVRGAASELSPDRGNRLVCMCDDCQVYARWLDRAAQVLDANGGTDVFQLTPAQLTITEGVEHIRCVRLSPKGLMRWYAGCCNTPIANTLASPKVPFAGVLHTFMDHEGDGRSRDEVLGPVRARVNARFGHGPLPADAHARAPVGLIVRAITKLLSGWIRRAHTPSPFFRDGGQPIVEPAIVPNDEREQLRQALGDRPRS